MNKQTKISATDEAWNDGELGRDEKYVVKVSQEEAASIMASVSESLDLQAISIRLPKSLIEDFKAIAEYRGLGYQPLMRQILQRFASSEGRLIMRELLDKEKEESEALKIKKCA
jgi:predicted DNA binding CopG/RHH family protein